jgi:hypothetical protein
MNSFRQEVDEEGAKRKDSYFALEKLFLFYENLQNAEKPMAAEVISEWLLSVDENIRFDALAIVNEFRVLETIPALQVLARRLCDPHEPGSPYELRKVQRALRNLGG